jgi:cell division septum initiation protein DivIVA
VSYSTEVRTEVAIPATGPQPSSPVADTVAFDLVLRGYDRRQVDEYMMALAIQLSEIRVAHQREQRRADRAEGEVRTIRGQLAARDETPAETTSPGPGFGYRVEKLLRAAEAEAVEARSSAAREATALLERAREDAEAHRHTVEQSLITRTVALDQEAAQRAVELDEREREIAARAEAAREHSDQLVAEAKQHSEQLRQDARAGVEQERAAAEQAIRERHLAAERELGRLRALHSEVRGQLARLLDSLAAEFGGAANLPQPKRQLPPQPRSYPQPHPRARLEARMEPEQPGSYRVEQPAPVVALPTPPEPSLTEAIITEAR